MTDTLSDLLERNRQQFSALWTRSDEATNGKTRPRLSINCYDGVIGLLRGDDTRAWRRSLQDAGGAFAEAQLPVRELVSEAVEFLDTLRSVAGIATPGDEQYSNPRDSVERIQTEMFTELLSGYSEGQDRKSEELRLALDEVNGLHKIISAANSSLEFQPVIDQVVQTVANVMRVEICSVFTYEPEIDMLVLRASKGLSNDMVGKFKMRLGEGVTGWAGRTGKPVALSDAWSDPRFIHIPQLGEEQTRAMLAVPIVLFTKLKLVGVISLQTLEERIFGEREIKFLETVAGEIAIAIENARLYGETDARLHQKVVELTTLQGVSASIAATLNLREVLNLIAMEAAQLVSVDAAVVYELRESKLEPVAGYGFGAEQFGLRWSADARDARQRNGESEGQIKRDAYRSGLQQNETPQPLPRIEEHKEQLIASTMQTGRTLFLGRGSAKSSVGQTSLSGNMQPASYQYAPPPPYASEFCVPLAAPRGILGSICLFSREERHFSAEQVSLLEAFAREGAIAMENARLYEETRHGLEVKTLLLREIHHRVRNNLQRTASLLRMQSQRMPADNPAIQALQESVIRIQSIARVHDLLSREQIGITDVASVANLAVDVVSNTLARPDQHIHWRTVSEPIPLSSQEAFPMTLLLTELMSNSVLHGFSSRDEGHVTISATLEDGELKISIQDDGRGLPEGFSVDTGAHMGLEVVRRLGEQELGGKLTIQPADPGPGTRSTLIFPYNPSSMEGTLDVG